MLARSTRTSGTTVANSSRRAAAFTSSAAKPSQRVYSRSHTGNDAYASGNFSLKVAHRAFASPRRGFATAVSQGNSSGVRVGTLFLALSILGLGATSVGLYNYYTSLKTFPVAIRQELRSALRCKARGDYKSADRYFKVAWEKALEMESDPGLDILKISGIGISWAEMLEETGRRADNEIPNANGEAYTVLCDTFNWTKARLQPSAGNAAEAEVAERMRAVAIAVKLASMAEGQAELEKQTEEQLTWAVEEILRLSTSGSQVKQSSTQTEQAVLVGEMDLPPWVTKTDLGATLESLGNLYARKGNLEYAMPLYLQSISLLLPPPAARKAVPTVAEKCHAATIMNNLSSLIASASTAPSADISQTKQASAWASKAADIATHAINSSSNSEVSPEADVCKPTLVVALYNLGMLKLLEDDKKGARELLGQAKTRAKEWRLKEAEVRANEAIRGL